MRTQKIYFPNQQAFCVFPDERSDLAQAIPNCSWRILTLLLY